MVDEVKAFSLINNIVSYIRRLPIFLNNTADTKHETNYRRNNTDTVHAKGSVFRGLLLFIKIFTQVFIRDYLINRFLKARSELEIKSPITRELILDGRIK